MLDQVLDVFDVRPDVDLGLMHPNQTLGSLTARAIAACDLYLGDAKADMVLVQGDTTTAFCAALAAFYHRIPVGHVEAGLRTWDKFSPFPEEINRTLTTRLSDYHFAPTPQARENLLREAVSADRIFVTGNTPSLMRFSMPSTVFARIPPRSPRLQMDLRRTAHARRLVLITGHRRENFGDRFESICRAVSRLAQAFPQSISFIPFT